MEQWAIGMLYKWTQGCESQFPIVTNNVQTWILICNVIIPEVAVNMDYAMHRLGWRCSFWWISLTCFSPCIHRLSKLEVITYVIDYIRDLRQTLGMPPTLARIPPIPSMDMEMDSDLSSVDSLTSTSTLLPHPTHHHHSSSSRTPLSLISTPNNSSSSCASQSSQEVNICLVNSDSDISRKK